MIKLDKLSELQKIDLFKRLRVNMAYHSNAIEGLQLGYNETKDLLTRNLTAPSKSLVEHLIYLGFADAYDFVVAEASRNVLSEKVILFMHRLLFGLAENLFPGRFDFTVGAWRQHEVYITGTNVVLAKPEAIPGDMDKLMKYAQVIDNRRNSAVNFDDIADFHIQFERTHPFGDGNGRVGRLIILYQAIRMGVVPPNILVERRREYYDTLNRKGSLSELLTRMTFSVNEETHPSLGNTSQYDQVADMELLSMLSKEEINAQK